MSEREQKLEAALRDSRRWIELTITNMFHQSPERYDILKNIDAALATPPTSEWNEALTEVIALVASGKGDDQALLRQRIRALKRKEQS